MTISSGPATTHRAHQQVGPRRFRGSGASATVHRAHQITPRIAGDQAAVVPGTLTLTSPLPIRAEPGTGHIPSAPGWGLREDGTGYYDPNGAAPGEAADLMMGPDGNLYLQPHALD